MEAALSTLRFRRLPQGTDVFHFKLSCQHSLFAPQPGPRGFPQTAPTFRRPPQRHRKAICISKQGHHHNGDQAVPRPHILCSICFYSFGALAKAERLFIALLHNQPMYSKMCYIEIFDTLQLTGWLKFEMGTIRPPVWGVRWAV